MKLSVQKMTVTAVLSVLFVLTITLFEDSSNRKMQVIEEDILQGFDITEDEHILSFYSDYIEECERLGTSSYLVESINYDLDSDGNNETISYFMSSIHSGSTGNVEMNVIDRDKKISFDHAIDLNPHHDENRNYKQLKPSLQILESRSNGYYDLRYIITDAENRVVAEDLFKYDGKNYVKNQSVENDSHMKT